ncbi:MAG TPA: 50S ribosomal protein L18 [Candidatus Cloacimonetes bacterium]|nr:50S ribosomal protein L18 [Candidatus Cloacimonadota bacterium]HEX37891.1 50S ribosomal protein L18 [Candidatus Cloacimonadota bacterium]
MLRRKVRKNILLRKRRKVAIRNKISGTKERPRMSVYRSLNQIYVQAIDDDKGVTLCAFSSLSPDYKEKVKKDMKPVEKAQLVGELFAQLCLKKKIKQVSFDRNGFKYHGRVKALAEGARKAGLEF